MNLNRYETIFVSAGKYAAFSFIFDVFHTITPGDLEEADELKIKISKNTN